MEELKQKLASLKGEVTQLRSQLSIDEKLEQLGSFQEKIADPDFWQDSVAAQRISKQAAKLEKVVAPWQDIESKLSEVDEFLSLSDESMADELHEKVSVIERQLESLKGELRFSGPHDYEDAVLTIQAGAGGTDAQDWAEMLKRMYLRWANRHDMKVSELSETPGDEAGIKNVSLLVSGDKTYGQLKAEHGVHRLVRLSPFNTAGSRETSFAMVEVTPQIDEPDEVEILDEDLKIDVYRAGGHGGQSVNTTDSAVRITHLPTGITVAIQNERSQIQNKATAMSVLASKLAQLAEEQHAEKIAELRGPNVEAAWGNQIRSYVLHPYTMVKDLRTKYETADVQSALDGGEALDEFIHAYLEYSIGDTKA